jgi:hypothetical protein
VSPRRGAAPAESVLRWLGDQQYADGSLGLPVNVTINRTAAAMPDGNNSYQRPDRVAGMSIYAKNRTPQNWLNLAAFATPPMEPGATRRRMPCSDQTIGTMTWR